MDIDLIVMASSKVTSPIMGITSITRRVIDGTNRPVLVIHRVKILRLIKKERNPKVLMRKSA